MRRPGHLANAAPPGPALTLPEVPGLDLTLAADNVRRAGGDPARFAASVNAALVSLPPGQDPTACVVIAAWRAGALAYRNAALAQLEALLAAGAHDTGAPAAALGLDSATVEAFAVAQRTDRFWWPDRTANRGYVCAVGGFAGIGGAWIAPPRSGIALGEPGAFAILTGEDWWRLDADVWGHRLVPLDAAPEPTAFTSPATIVCQDDSYLAWLHVAEPA